MKENRECIVCGCRSDIKISLLATIYQQEKEIKQEEVLKEYIHIECLYRLLEKAEQWHGSRKI